MGCSQSKVQSSANPPSKEAVGPQIFQTSELRPRFDPAAAGERILAAKYEKDVGEFYNLSKVLGKGQFGTTRIANHKGTGEKYACKTISKRKLLKPQNRDDVRQELAIMDHLSGHPNVIAFVEAFEDAHNIHIIMELCSVLDHAGGELFDRIVSRGHYSERSASQIIRAILEVVAHCHSMGVVHRDLKPENFLLSCPGNAAELKAIDFGLSAFFLPDEYLSDIVGSAYYVAPEVLRKQYSYQCDIWSCGVILYILLCGIPPFYAESETAIFRQIMKGSIDFESHPWPSISTEAKDCIRRMLTRDVTKRATAAQILQHQWLVDKAAASDKPLENEIKNRLEAFQNLNKLKREALKLIASHMPPDEVQGLCNQFKAMDKDGNGIISVEELRQALANNSKIPGSNLATILEGVDLNLSGSIDYEEFLAATLHASKVATDEHLQRAFQEFDKDGSGLEPQTGLQRMVTKKLHFYECTGKKNICTTGSITADELKQAIQGCTGGGYKMEDIDEILQKVDKDKDGCIDYAEFVEMMVVPTDEPVRRRRQHIKF